MICSLRLLSECSLPCSSCDSSSADSELCDEDRTMFMSGCSSSEEVFNSWFLASDWLVWGSASDWPSSDDSCRSFARIVSGVRRRIIRADVARFELLLVSKFFPEKSIFEIKKKFEFCNSRLSILKFSNEKNFRILGFLKKVWNKP